MLQKRNLRLSKDKKLWTDLELLTPDPVCLMPLLLEVWSTALAPAGSLLEIGISNPDTVSQNLHFNKIPKKFTLKSK